jgi:hypothetical protein
VELHTLYAMRQTAGTTRANVSGCSDDEQRGSAQVPAFERTHLPDALDNETNRQSIACGEDRTLPLRELIEVALDEDGTEPAETCDPCARFDGAGRRPAYACSIISQMGICETVGRDEGVDIETMRFRAGDGCNFDVTDCPGRDPGQDVPDLVIRQRRTLGSTKDREYIGSRTPTFLMPDQSKIDFG